MLKQPIDHWELLGDLTHLDDWELLRVLCNAKCAAQEMEAAINDNRSQTVIDALLQWESVEVLEQERKARCLQETEVAAPMISGFRLSSIEGQHHTGEVLWVDSPTPHYVVIVRARANNQVVAINSLPHSDNPQPYLSSLLHLLDQLSEVYNTLS